MKVAAPALFRLLALILACSACLVTQPLQAAEPMLPVPPVRPEMAQGVALGLHFQDPEASYEGYLWEIARTGADTVSLVVSWSQTDIRATELAPRAGETPPDEGYIRMQKREKGVFFYTTENTHESAVRRVLNNMP